MTNRTRRLAVAATLLVALLVPAGAASAKGNGNGNGRATAPGQVQGGEARGGQPDDDEADDDADEADDDADDSQGGRPAVPPGLAKKGEEAGSRGNRPEGTPATGALPPGWARAAERAATRPATLTGTVASVEGGIVTVTVKGGHPLFRLWAAQDETAAAGTIKVELAPDAVVKLDDEVATLADLAVGDHVSIRGTFADGTVTAGRVNAATPDETAEAESD